MSQSWPGAVSQQISFCARKGLGFAARCQRKAVSDLGWVGGKKRRGDGPGAEKDHAAEKGCGIDGDTSVRVSDTLRGVPGPGGRIGGWLVTTRSTRSS